MRTEVEILDKKDSLFHFSQDLFANGFWSTVNNNFNDVKHQIKEYQNLQML
jgi:hypothetical protein